MTHFTAAQGELAAALKAVSLAVADRPIAPVLGGVVIETRPGSVTLRAFDFETSVSVRVTGDADGEGRELVDCGELRRMLAAAVVGEKPAAATRTPVRVGDGALSTPDFKMPLKTLPPEEYPAFPEDVPASVTVDGAEWFRQLARVLPAAATDDLRPVLRNVHLVTGGGGVSLTATNAYRIATAEVPAEDGGWFETEALVPAGLLVEVSRLLGRHTGPVTLGVRAEDGLGWVTLTVGPVTITTRYPATGGFPNVEGFMPAEGTPLAVQADRDALVRAVRKAVALAKAKTDRDPKIPPRVLLEFGPAGVTVSPDLTTDAEQARVRGILVPGKPLAGEGLDEPARFTGTYLLDALGAFGGESVVLHAQGPFRPLLFTDGLSVGGVGYRHLVMPLCAK